MKGPDEDLAHELSHQREAERVAARASIQRGDPPWHHAMGVQAAVEAARDLRFPLTSAQVRRRAGNRYLQATARLSVPVAEVLAHLPETRFGSLREFERAVQKHWQGIRYLEVPREQRSPRGGGRASMR